MTTRIDPRDSRHAANPRVWDLRLHWSGAVAVITCRVLRSEDNPFGDYLAVTQTADEVTVSDPEVGTPLATFATLDEGIEFALAQL